MIRRGTETGALLRKTIEAEALCTKKLDEAREEAVRIIRSAEQDAESILAAGTERIRTFRESSRLAAEKKETEIREEAEKKSITIIRNLNERFDAVSDLLAAETADRIIRHDR